MPDYARQLGRLQELGPRLSGTDAHRALITDVAAELAELGYDVHRDPHVFERWEVADSEVALSIAETSVPVSSAWPYSGETPPEGIAAPLVLLDGRRKNWKAARGKIAVVDVHNADVPTTLLASPWSDSLPFDSTANPVISSELAGTDLTKARAAGVRGVVATWRGLGDEAARGQYLPFTRDYQGIPAIWTPESQRDAIRAAAQRGSTATLILPATRTPGARMDTVWAVSPGTGPHADESILVVTHSDGGNAVEENGHLGLLALARDAAAAPHDRTIVFVCTAGHLRMPAVTAHGQATTAWLDAHPEMWSPDTPGLTAVAGLAIEHLGAKHLHVDPQTGRYEADGSVEPELLYATTRELADLTRAVWHGAAGRSARPVKPGALIHFGEGEPLFERRIPAIALVTGPDYLLADVERDLVDLDALAEQIGSFRRLQAHLAGAENSAAFGRVRLPGKAKKVVAALRAILFLARHA